MQTSYSAQAAVAFAGLEADIRDSVKVHAINEESAAIPFGIALARGASGDKVRLPTAATDVIQGVAVQSHWADNQALSNSDGIDAGASFNLMERGAIWVKVEEAVSKGDQAWVRFATGTGTQLGAFRKSADSGTARRLKNARFESDADAGGYALLVLEWPVDERDEAGPVVHEHVQTAWIATLKLFKTPADRYFVITGVDYVNPTGLAADAASYFNLKVQHGSTVAANWSTQTGQEGSLAADVMVAMTLAALTDRVVPPSTEVALMLDETGTATLPVGRAAIKGYWL